jgi:glycine oxidase
MSSQKEIVIIGAGVTGCSIAYHLSRQGIPSQVIERDSIANRASGKAWGIIPYPPFVLVYEGTPEDYAWSMPAGKLRSWIELFWLGYHRFRDTSFDLRERGGIDIEYGEYPSSSVTFSDAGEKFLKARLSHIRGEGYNGSWLDDKDLRAIFPDVNPRARGGMCLPNLEVEPYKYTLGLAQAAEKMGVNFRQGEVVGFRKKGAKATAVTLATGTEIEADVMVIATGPWANQCTSPLGQEIPMRYHHDQCLRVSVPKQFPLHGIDSTRVSIVPKMNGDVIIGGIGGITPVQQGFNGSLTTADAAVALTENAVGMLPRFRDATLIEQRGDLEAWGVPPYNIQPVLGRLPEWDNVYVATRMGGLGITLSLGVGRVMADLIIAGGRVPDHIKTLIETLSPAKK